MQLQVESWTPSARDWLADTTEARVLHLFHDVCNLANAGNRVLSITGPDLPRTAFSVRLLDLPKRTQWGGFAEILEVSSGVTVGPAALEVGDLRFEIGEPDLWDPIPDWTRLGAEVGPPEVIRPFLTQALVLHGRPGGFLELRPGQFPGTSAVSHPEPSERSARAAQPMVGRFQEAISARDLDGIQSAVRELAGLGNGLTPSGDDFLVGAMHSLYLRLGRESAAGLGDLIQRSTRGRTSLLSQAWIQAAARGEAAEVWHLLLDGLASKERGLISEAAGSLARMGHSSGTDGLVGFLLVDELAE